MLVVRRGSAPHRRVAKPQIDLADRGGQLLKNPLGAMAFEEGSRSSSKYPVLGMQESRARSI